MLLREGQEGWKGWKGGDEGKGRGRRPGGEKISNKLRQAGRVKGLKRPTKPLGPGAVVVPRHAVQCSAVHLGRCSCHELKGQYTCIKWLHSRWKEHKIIDSEYIFV